MVDEIEDDDRCDHGKLYGSGVCWACEQDDREGARVRAERATRQALTEPL